jgi:hypothetical protein
MLCSAVPVYGKWREHWMFVSKISTELLTGLRMAMARAKNFHQTQMAVLVMVMSPAGCCVAVAAAVSPQDLAGQSRQQTAHGCSCNCAAQVLIGLLQRLSWQQVAWPKRWAPLKA